MGRRPKLRASFYDDILYLMRLSHALEKDTSLDKAWRTRMQEKCKELANEFMQGDAHRKPEKPDKPEKPEKKKAVS